MSGRLMMNKEAYESPRKHESLPFRESARRDFRNGYNVRQGSKEGSISGAAIEKGGGGKTEPTAAKEGPSAAAQTPAQDLLKGWISNLCQSKATQ